MTLAEIDESLAHARTIPVDERGDTWAAWVDGLLAQRRRLTGPLWAERETAVMHAPETR